MESQGMQSRSSSSRSSSRRRMSITSLCNSDASTPKPFPHDEDQDVQMAIAALDSLRASSVVHSPNPNSTFTRFAASDSLTNSSVPTSIGQSEASTPAQLSSPTSSVQEFYFPGSSSSWSSENQQQGEEGFIGRVSQFPLVSGAIKAYERGKNSSRVVRYGTDLVESSVKRVSAPVLGRVVSSEYAGQLDEFACRQLDRLYPAASPPSRRKTRNGYFDSRDLPLPDLEEHSTPTADEHSTLRQRRITKDDSEDEQANNSALTRTPSQQGQQEVSRSMWQSLIVEASVTAGGIGAAVSEESMKSLKYCLQWLQYATAHMDQQVLSLRDLIISLSPSSPSMQSNEALAVVRLSSIKHDVVETIRKVVNVMSTYAGAALPEHAKRFVRSSILGLPEKWAHAMGEHNAAVVAIENGQTRLKHSTEEAAERVLTFAVESLDMLRGLTQLFAESVDRADAWVERLRILGVQQQRKKAEALANQNQHELTNAPSTPMQGASEPAARAAMDIDG